MYQNSYQLGNKAADLGLGKIFCKDFPQQKSNFGLSKFFYERSINNKVTMDQENQQFYYMCMNHLQNSPKSKKVKIISTPQSEAQVVADFI